MEILQNYDLSSLNTFGIKVNARFFVAIESETDLSEIFNLSEFKQNKKVFLGGGSNVLFTKNFDGIIVLNKLKGIEIISENSNTAIIRAMSGEDWHNLVMFSVNHGYWGIENLSLIPGTVGAAPMQNIGAYGAELRDVLQSVETFDIVTGMKRVFSTKECELGYRDSIFKNKLKDQYFISAITLRLGKLEKKNITYKALVDYLKENRLEIHSSKDVSNAVASIRKSKLPDPEIICNAGSFFKNVFVGEEKMKEMLKVYPDVPYFEESADVACGYTVIKIPAGWLIDQCGWKGKRVGNVGVHEKHALVLVNYGGGSGEDIKNLAEQIIASVNEKFGLQLIPEVNLI